MGSTQICPIDMVNIWMNMDHGGIGTLGCRWDKISILSFVAGLAKSRDVSLCQRWQCRTVGSLQFVGAW